MTEIADGLEWKHIYWVSGNTPKGYGDRNEVKNPPCSGWQHAFVLVGPKRSTIFCPVSFDAFTVRNDCGELKGAVEPRDPFDKARMVARIHKNWKTMQERGWAKDYDTAALVLKRLGAVVPTQSLKGGGEDTRKKGGKDVESKLKKPVKRSGKRGKFLEWFLDGDGSRSVREAMAEFSMTRSNALSYLYMLQKDHGIGYELVGDVATVTLPEGCDNPFDEGPAPDVKPAKVEETDDDSWLDGDDVPDEDDDSWLE